MPTNKLWIEHTERAAWDSVEALRERLSKAEQRLQSLMPNVARVPELLDLLREAKQKYAIDAQGQDQIVAELMARIDALQARLDAASAPAEPAVVHFGAAVARDRFDSDELDEAPDSGSDDQLDIGKFTQTMRRRHEASGTAPPRDLNRLLSMAETKLDDLAELEGSALREAAVELAILSALIGEASHGKA